MLQITPEQVRIQLENRGDSVSFVQPLECLLKRVKCVLVLWEIFVQHFPSPPGSEQGLVPLCNFVVIHGFSVKCKIVEKSDGASRMWEFLPDSSNFIYWKKMDGRKFGVGLECLSFGVGAALGRL